MIIKKLFKKIKDLNFYWRISWYIALYGLLLFVLQNAQALHFIKTVPNPNDADINNMLQGFHLLLKSISIIYILLLMLIELKIKRTHNA